MSKFPFIPQTSYDSGGDDNKYLWSTRITEEVHQRLADISSEHHLSKAETLRQIILFAIECMAKEGTELSEKVRKRIIADSKRRRAIQEQDERFKAHKYVIELLTRASTEEDGHTKAMLRIAAKETAAAWHIEFPPPGLPFIAIDKDAAYVYGKVKKVAEENNTTSIKLNELNPRIHNLNADQLREILKRLEEHDYVDLSEERTSGPSTLWITLPTLPLMELSNY